MKGILKTFEVVIGLSIVMFAFVSLYTGQQELPELDTIAWRYAGLNALQSLDYSNQLRYDALNNNTALVEGRVGPYLPANINYLLQVCGSNCTGPTLNAKKSASIQYFISGDANNSTAREIILYMWSNE